MAVQPTFPGNPRQKWQFKIEIDGFDAAYFVESDIPKLEIESVEFNPAGSVRSTKFAGRAKYEDITMKKGMPSENADLTARNWFKKAVNTNTGVAGVPSDYKKDIEIVHIDKAGNAIDRWLLKGAWVRIIETEKGEGGSSDFVFETLTIAFDDVEFVG